MPPIFRIFSRTGSEIPDAWIATTSAIGATPVALEELVGAEPE
jgi:hypothetical protein